MVTRNVTVTVTRGGVTSTQTVAAPVTRPRSPVARPGCSRAAFQIGAGLGSKEGFADGVRAGRAAALGDLFNFS